MTYEPSGTMVVDEIDRLSVAYEKAKEYLSKISSNLDQQIDLWQYRRQIILDQFIQMKSSSSYDFLLPKTQRINELTLEAVEALCRVDVLFEQILRIDPKSRVATTSILLSTRPSETNLIRQMTPGLVQQSQTLFNGQLNGQPKIPMPVLRTQQPQIPSGRSSTLITQEKVGFKPVVQQQQPSPSVSQNTSRPPSVHPYNSTLYSTNETSQSTRPIPPSYGPRTTQSESVVLPFVTSASYQMTTNYQQRKQQPQIKEQVKLARIPPGTKWKRAKIDIIDSLSGFYTGNLDPKVHDQFLQMQHELQTHYNDLDNANQLMPLENVAIGDFGIAKFSEDDYWYRARLITCEGHNQIKIVYVDFGNIEIKSTDEFFPLEKAFTELPAQAIACSLSEAFPRSQIENDPTWPEETIETFKNAVTAGEVEIHFDNQEEGTKQWPLHFVRIFVDNQSVTNLLNLQHLIDPRPNCYIADQMAPFLSLQEYILFNVPINADDDGH